jgi:hypothetical protein
MTIWKDLGTVRPFRTRPQCFQGGQSYSFRAVVVPLYGRYISVMILWSVWHQEFERTGLVTVTRWLDSPCVCWTFYVFSRNDQQEVSTRVRPAVERPKPPTQGPKAWVKCAKEGGCWINHPHSSYTAFCCWFLERSRESWKLLFVDEVCKPLLVFLSYLLVFVCSRRVVVRDSAIVHFC